MKFNHFPGLLTFITIILFSFNRPVDARPVEKKGPLRVSEKNPGYFTDNTGKAVYLTGSHTWNNLVDMTLPGSSEKFDYEKYIRWMKELNHNFIRLWTWELLNWEAKMANNEIKIFGISPHPWMRTGPGKASDGGLKFDLNRFNPEYFDRLEERIRIADTAGIYVSIMLFEGYGLQFYKTGLKNHPFCRENNINGINGDVNGDSSGVEIHELADIKVLSIQEAYVEHIIDIVNKYDNVLYEISNENHPASTEWQYHMINFIKDYEKKMPWQHPVGMTFQYRGGTNKTLFDSPADWISPNPEGGYRTDPPASSGSKVILTDTDHLWGIGGNRKWVWKSFLRGLNPLFMDPYDCKVLNNSCDSAFVGIVRKSLGYTREIADRLDLNSMIPIPGLASSGYCMADKGYEYLVYLPDNKSVVVDLRDVCGKLLSEWFDPETGQYAKPGKVRGGNKVTFTSPFGTSDAVLYLRKRR
jgi:hypothetical protein